MTLLELVELLKLEKKVSLSIIPDSIGRLSIVNEEDTCRYAVKNYLTSMSFVEDVVCILDKIIFIQLQSSPLLSDFGLKFTKDTKENLHLELVYN